MSDIERKRRYITRGLLKRVIESKGDAEPEFRLFAKEWKLGMAERFFYDTFPEGVVRRLRSALPENQSIGRITAIWDFRKEHNFPSGYIPAGYQLPLKD